MAIRRLSIEGLREFKDAIRRSPQHVRDEVGKFLARGGAAYKTIINGAPWKMGMSGGGAPEDTRHLKDTHKTAVYPWKLVITPTAPYAAAVHGLEGVARKRSYQLRPWLDYAQEQGDPQIQQHEKTLMDSIINNLAS